MSDPVTNPIELDHAKLFTLIMQFINRGEDGGNSDEVAVDIRNLITEYGEASFKAGRDSVFRAGTVRAALLEAQAHWLDNADTATGPEGKTVAKIIAMVFGELADEYRKTPKPFLDPPPTAGELVDAYLDQHAPTPAEMNNALHEQLQEDAAVLDNDQFYDEELAAAEAKAAALHTPFDNHSEVY